MNAIEIKIDEKQLASFVSEGGKLMVKREANDGILALLRLSRMIDVYIRQVKDSIVTAAIAVNPDFKGVFGSQVKGIYKSTGRKYSFDKNTGDIEHLVEAGLIRPMTIYVPVSEAIEEFEKEHELPAGIIKNERNKDLYFTVKEELL